MLPDISPACDTSLEPDDDDDDSLVDEPTCVDVHVELAHTIH